MRNARPGRLLAGALVAATLVACTPGAGDPSPSPSPSPSPDATPTASSVAQGDRIAIVVPPAAIVAPAEAAALEAAGRRLSADLPSGIAEVRVVAASRGAYVRDLAQLAVDDGFDVVCVVGTGAAEVALQLAREERATRFCATDVRIAGGPVNLVAAGVDPDVLVDAGAAAIGSTAPPVGLLLSPQLGDVEDLTEVFASALAPAPPSPVPSPAPSPAPTGASPAPSVPATPRSPAPPPVVAVPSGAAVTAQVTAGEQLAAARPSRALVLATPGGAATATAASATGATLVVVADWAVDPEGAPPPNLLVGITVDWGAVLIAALDLARTEDTEQVRLLGAGDGVLGAIAGQAQGAAPATDRAVARLTGDTP